MSSQQPGEGRGDTKERGSQFLRSAAEAMFGSHDEGTAEPPEDQRTWKHRATGIVRRRLRLSLSDLYLQLGAALAERHRFEEATDAFRKALDEGGMGEDVLEDLAQAAQSAGAHDLALRARLELALLRPDRAEVLTARASKLLDEDVAAAQGRWVLEEWRTRIEQRELLPGAVFEAELLAGRAAAYRGEDEKGLELFGEAVKAAPERAAIAAERVVQPDALPTRWLAEDASGHWLRARAYAAFELSEKAIEETNAALAETTAGANLDDEVAMLDLKVQLLESADRSAEAAEALVELGRRHDQRIEHGRAVELYLRATELDPLRAESWWYLADSRRLAALEVPTGDAEVRRAREELQTGLGIRPPSADEAWVYWVGALLAEDLANRSDDVDELLFEAALCAEQGVALDASIPGLCALPARYHRLLRNPATSMVALAQAAWADAADQGVLLERALTLAELGVESALDAIDEYEQLHPADYRLVSVRGFVLLYLGRYEEAESVFRAAHDQQPDDATVLILRALARGLLGDLEGAREDGLQVLELTASDAVPDLAMEDLRAWAALLTRDFDEARALFSQALAASSTDPVDVRLGLACAEQIGGDPARAAELLAEAVQLARYPRHAAVGRLTLELAERLRMPVAWQADPELFELAAERLAERRYDVGEALDEVAAVAQAGVEGETRWLTAVAARARMLAFDGRWAEAADAYEELLLSSGESPSSPLATFAPARSRLAEMMTRETDEAIAAGDVLRVKRAHRRLVELVESSERLPLAVAAAHRNAGRPEEALRELEPLRQPDGGDPAALAAAGLLSGDVLLELQRPEEAAAAYGQALEAVPETALEERAVLETRLGVAAAMAGETARALGLMRSALAVVLPLEGRTRAARTVIGTCTDVVSFAGTPPLLPMTVRALLEDREVRRGQRRRLASTRFEVLRAESTVADGAGAAIFPVVLEADEELFPAGAQTEGVPELLDDSIPAMRRRILEDTGVLIPGVQIRASQALSNRGFRFHLHGVPYAGGRLPERAILCTDAGAGRERGLTGEPLPNAWLGDEAAIWIDGDVHEAELAGLPLLGAFDAMLWTLEGLVRLHLHGLVGLAEIDYRVEEWRIEDAAQRSDLVAAALPDQHARICLTAVIRTLVQEQVSVADLGTVLRAFADAGTGPESVHEAVEAVRAALADAAPTSQPQEVLM